VQRKSAQIRHPSNQVNFWVANINQIIEWDIQEKSAQYLFCETLVGIVFATQYQIQIKLLLIFAPVNDE